MNQVRCQIGELQLLDVKGLDLHAMAHLVPDMRAEFYREFVEDVRTHGLKTPLEVSEDGVVLDGRHRLLAAIDIGLERVPCRIVDLAGEDPVEFMYRAGTQRRDLTPTQRVAMAVDMDRYRSARDDAKERQREAAARGGSAERKVPATLPEPSSGYDADAEYMREMEISPPVSGAVVADVIHRREVGRAKKQVREVARQRESRAVLAKEARVSPRTAQKVITVLEAAKKDPELRKLVPAMKAGDVSADEAMKRVNEKRKGDLAAKLRSLPPPTPKGPFRVIVLDPPWQYRLRKGDLSHKSQNQYPDMSVEEICALPVATMAEPNCLLWLWTTNAFMRDAFKCLDAWGFEEKTILTWVKNKIGTGDWLRGQTEHCILAVRGSPMVTLTNQTTLLRADRREHSRKPDEFYAMVDQLCPGTKLEMFSREPRAGWAAWGAEVDKFTAA